MFELTQFLKSLTLTNQSQTGQTPRGDSRGNNPAACLMFRCGHGLFNQQGTISIQMLGYILMVPVCAGKDRKFRSRQSSKEMEQQAVHNKLAGAHLIPVTAQYHQKGDIGLYFTCPFVVLHLCSQWIHCSGESRKTDTPTQSLKPDSHMVPCCVLGRCLTALWSLSSKEGAGSHSQHLHQPLHVAPLSGFLSENYSVHQAWRNNMTILSASPQIQPLVFILISD